MSTQKELVVSITPTIQKESNPMADVIHLAVSLGIVYAAIKYGVPYIRMLGTEVQEQLEREQLRWDQEARRRRQNQQRTSWWF